MKIYPERLAAELSNKIPLCALIFGDEALLSIEASDQIVNVAKSNGFLEKFEFDLNGHFEKDEIFNHFCSLSLFSEKKIIILSLTKTTKDNTAFIREITPLVNPDVLLILKGPYLKKQQLKSVWFTGLEKQGLFIATNPPFSNQFPSWISSRLRSVGLSASQEVISYLCVHFEGNLLAAKQEFEKLALLYPKQNLTLQQVQESITSHNHFSVFQWIDSLLEGKKNRASRILAQLRAEGTELILISATLNIEIQKLLKLSYQSKATPINVILNNQKPKLWPAKIQMTIKVLSRLSMQDLEKLTQQCAALEVALKIENTEDNWLKIAAIAYLFY